VLDENPTDCRLKLLLLEKPELSSSIPDKSLVAPKVEIASTQGGIKPLRPNSITKR
jgi:hypothetical protein